jgi:hypothetical protein
MAAAKFRTSLILCVLLVCSQPSSPIQVSSCHGRTLITHSAVYALPRRPRLLHHHHRTPIHLEPIALSNGFGMDRFGVSTDERCRGARLRHSSGDMGAQTSSALRHHPPVWRFCHLRLGQHCGSVDHRARCSGVRRWRDHSACQYLDQ